GDTGRPVSGAPVGSPVIVVVRVVPVGGDFLSELSPLGFDIGDNLVQVLPVFVGEIAEGVVPHVHGLLDEAFFGVKGQVDVVRSDGEDVFAGRLRGRDHVISLPPVRCIEHYTTNVRRDNRTMQDRQKWLVPRAGEGEWL